LQFPTFAAKFFRQKEFRGQKKCGFPDAMASVPENDLRRWCQSVAKLTAFLPTFAPDFFSFFNFRPENFPVFQISSRKKSGPQTFEPEIFGRKKFQTVRPARDRPDQFWETCTTLVVKPATTGTFPDFRGDLFEFF